MNVNISEIYGQMAELFCVDPVETEIELLNLQNDVQFESQQHVQHFLSLVEPENYNNLCQAALKIAALFGSKYLCESAFSNMYVIKSRLTDEHLKDYIRVNLNVYIPAYSCELSCYLHAVPGISLINESVMWTKEIGM